MNQIEKWFYSIYSPKPAPWKLPALKIISIVIFVLCFIGGWTQIQYYWTNDGVWYVLGTFCFFSIIGFWVSLFRSDFWVAMIIGRP